MQNNTAPFCKPSALILRDFREEDWRDAHIYGSDPEVVNICLLALKPKKKRRHYCKGNCAAKRITRLFYDFALETKLDH